MRTGLGTVLPARKLSSMAALEGLEGHKIGRRFWAYYHDVDFGNYQMFQVGKLLCDAFVVPTSHRASFSFCCCIGLGVRLWN